MGRNQTEQGKFLPLFKGVLLTVILNLGLILAFAFVVKVSLIGVNVIKWVNQFLKIIALFVGVFFSIDQNKGFLKGALIGLASSLITVLIFALLGSEGQTFVSILLDTLFCGIVGGIMGVLAVNRN